MGRCNHAKRRRETRTRRGERAQRRARIDALKTTANRLAGGKLVDGVKRDCPPEIEEKFWRNVIAFEQREQLPLFDQLSARGLELPSPESLSDAQMEAKLRELIDALAQMRTYLLATDHLSDRELYTDLWSHNLRLPEPLFEPDADWALQIDLLARARPQDTEAYFKYYAPDMARSWFRMDFPNKPLPERSDPPFDRDRLLPQPTGIQHLVRTRR